MTTKFNPKDSVWTEKYRPRIVKDIVGKDVRDKVTKYLSNPNNMPHFLFHSATPGTGKTSICKCIVNELDADCLVLNSSDERKIETIREKVKEFALTKSARVGKRRIVFLDETDGMCLPYGTKIITGTLKNPLIKKIEEMNDKKNICIPSVNIETGKLENDKGILVKSGIADFFEIELENEEKIIASSNHPFFKKGFVKTKLKDLKKGDYIIDMSDKILHECPICQEQILNNQITCSMDCKNKYHSQEMIGKKNSMYGKKHSKETRNKISLKNIGHIESEEKKYKQSEFMKKNNPMNNYESRKKISIKLKGRNFTIQHRKRLQESRDIGLGTDNYEAYCLLKNKKPSIIHYKKKIINEREMCFCQICKKTLKTKGDWNKGLILHHIDKNRKNNNKKNILYCCSKCHNHIHLGYKYFSHNKWLEKYKKELKEKKVIVYGGVKQ